MIMSTHVAENNYAMIDEWPNAGDLPFLGVCGVIGPEVEANWITKILDFRGRFEWVIGRLSREQARRWLVDLGHSPASALVWVNRYYIPED